MESNKIFLVILLVLLFTNTISAQLSELENIEEKKQTIDELREQDKEGWIETIKQTDSFKNIENFLTFLSPVFMLLFAAPFSPSLILLITIVLWAWLSLQLSRVVLIFTKQKALALAIGFGATILLAHLRIINLLSTPIADLINKSENPVIKLFAFLFFAAVLVVAGTFIRIAIKKARYEKKKVRDEKVRAAQENVIAVSKELAENL